MCKAIKAKAWPPISESIFNNSLPIPAIYLCTVGKQQNNTKGEKKEEHSPNSALPPSFQKGLRLSQIKTDPKPLRIQHIKAGRTCMLSAAHAEALRLPAAMAPTSRHVSSQARGTDVVT